MASIVPFQDGDKKRYRAYIRRQGYPSKSKVFDRVSDAKAWARANDHESAMEKSTPAHAKTLSALISDFSSDGPNYVKAAHLRFWTELLGDRVLASITPTDINVGKVAVQNGKALRPHPGGAKTTAKRRSPGTVNRYVSSISAVFNWAIARGVMKSNPVTVERGAVKRLKEGNGRTRILTREEEQRLLDAAKKSTWPLMQVFILVALTSAARRSELLNLRWVMVNLNEGLALVPTTKNGEMRQLPLVPEVREALTEIAPKNPESDLLVFADPHDPTRPIRSFDDIWKQCRVDAGLYRDRDDPLDQVVLHTTRHTGATKMVRAGKNAFQIARVTGHKTLGVLQKYTHLAGQDAIELANEVLANVGTTKS